MAGLDSRSQGRFDGLTPIIENKIILPRALPPVLGVGAYLKNALCLVQGNEAWLSVETGSLESPEAIRRFEETAAGFMAAAREKPVAIAHDLHPDFPCTRWAAASGLRQFPVQHHHAHIASVMAEHGIEGPVIGVAWDGFGLGERNEPWGGEFLRVDGDGYTRLGHLYPMPQPGGDVAAREPWRMGAAALYSLNKQQEIMERFVDYPAAGHLAMMMARGINAPVTSSAGRLFDAACGLLNVKPVAAFEGEAPMALESMVTEPQIDPDGWSIGPDGVLDMRPLLARLLECGAVDGANLFHGTLAAALGGWLEKAARETGIKTVVFGGGCFLNKVLREGVVKTTMGSGLNLLWPKFLPAGDTAIALGQAYAAALAIEKEG